MIALVPQHAQKLAPPRTLAVPFILGRPLGVPDDAAFQHRVLTAALGLLARTDGPVFTTYDEQAPSVSAADEPWSCPVSFSGSPELSLEAALRAEMDLLMPWYQRGKDERDFTAVGLSERPLRDVATLLAGFADGNVPDADAAQQLKLAAEDLKAFYNEAAVSQPGNASATDIENWYWQDTVAGKVIRQIKARFGDDADPALKLTAGFLLVPGSQS